MVPGFLQGSSSRFKRIITILACFIFCVLITVVGVLTPIGAQESQDTNKQLDQLTASIKDMGVWRGGLAIFENNFMISLIMFIPIAGPLFGSYALCNTGLAISAQSNSSENTAQLPGILILFVLFIFPHTWLEFIAYSTALASSLWLTWRIMHRRGRREVVRTGEFVAICAGLLLLGAFIEAYLISLM